MNRRLSLITAPSAEPLTVTEAKRHLRLGDSVGEPAPNAPAVTLADPAAPGTTDNGPHRVGVTFVTADGETELGPLSEPVTVSDKTVNGQLAVSAIGIGGSAVTARRLYLVPVAGGSALLAATVANNTDETATLNVADASLGVAAPIVNSTLDPDVLRRVRAARDRGELVSQRAFITQTWDYVLDAFPWESWIEIPRPPLQSVTYVRYVDAAGVTQELSAVTDYLVQAPTGPRASRGRVCLRAWRSWPVTLAQAGAVTVRFVAGYGATGASMPPLLIDALCLDLGTRHEHREDVIVGTGVASLPTTARDIYRSFKTLSLQR